MFLRKMLLIEIQDDGFSLAAANKKEILAYEHFSHGIQNGLSDIVNFKQVHKITENTTRLVLKSKQLIFRFATFPVMKRNELDFAAKSKIADLFPIDLKQYVVDYKSQKLDGSIEVMYAGAPSVMLERCTESLKEIKQKAVVVDVFQSCIARCLPNPDYCLLLSLSQSISLTIVEKGRIIAINEIPFDNSNDNNETFMELNRFFGIRKRDEKTIYMEEKLFLLEPYFKERGFEVQWIDPVLLVFAGLLLRKP